MRNGGAWEQAAARVRRLAGPIVGLLGVVALFVGLVWAGTLLADRQASAARPASVVGTPHPITSHHPCMALAIASADDGRPTAIAALTAAEEGKPGGLFALAGVPVPPRGQWIINRNLSQKMLLRFDHLAAGRVDWSAYLSESTLSGDGMKPTTRWYYSGGGPAPFPTLDSLPMCPEPVVNLHG